MVTEKDSEEPKYYSQLSRCASNLSVVHDITSTKLADESRVVLEEAVKDIVRLCQAAEVHSTSFNYHLAQCDAGPTGRPTRSPRGMDGSTNQARGAQGRGRPPD